MVCPKCGDQAHRSHSRNFLETLIKKIMPYNTYRCSKCGWRGLGAPKRRFTRRSVVRTILFWVAGFIIAMVIGGYALRDVQNSLQTNIRPTTAPE